MPAKQTDVRKELLEKLLSIKTGQGEYALRDAQILALQLQELNRVWLAEKIDEFIALAKER